MAEGRRLVDPIAPMLKHQKIEVADSSSRDGIASQSLKKDKLAPSTFAGLSSARAASDSTPTSTGSHLASSIDDAVPQADKGKDPMVDTFVNNLEYTFNKMTGVVLKGDLDPSYNELRCLVLEDGA